MFKVLSTIQKRNCLNTVVRKDEKGPGGGYHEYSIRSVGFESQLELANIKFQKGPRSVDGSTEGVTDQDLLEIVRDRLTAFQQGDLPSRETACALTHIEEALMWLNKRAEDRAERGVLGTYNK